MGWVLHWCNVQLLQAQDVVDTLHEANDDRLPGYQVSKPIQQLPIHDVRPLPAVKVLRIRGDVQKLLGLSSAEERVPSPSWVCPHFPAAQQPLCSIPWGVKG